MTNLEIKNLCLEQCNSYYNYVKNFTDNHGKSLTKVKSITKLAENIFEIKLEKPILNFEMTYYKNNLSKDLKQSIYYNKKDILIKEYDNKNRLLYIQVLRKEINFDDLVNKSEEFFIVSDLLFLIKNLIEWYEKNGDLLKLMNYKHLSLKYNTNNLIDTKLNENQISAVKTIFENQYSYIWGPPGTGKTRAVLSSSIINYINLGKKVLIVAPTNVALEQILYGVLENTQKLNIPNKTFLRVGTPSKTFLDKHSDICELKGLENQIIIIENELMILDKVVKYREGIEISFELENIDNLFLEIIKNRDKIKHLEIKKEELQPLLNILIQPLKSYHFSNNSKMLKDTIYKRRNFSFVNYNEKLIEDNKLEKVINIKLLRTELKSIEHNILDITKKSLELLDKAKRFSKSPKIFEEIFKDLTNDNLFEKREILLNKITSVISWSKKWRNSIQEMMKLNVDDLISEALNEHHKDFDNSRLIKRKNEIIKNKEKLIQQTTNSRIQSSLVVAMTIDMYIQYTLKDNISVDHIFCDEAGYMSNIKAITLFKNNCPITFLGDHMQLPPVSEVRNSDKHFINKTFLWSQSSIFFESIFIKKDINELFLEYENKITPSYKIAKQKNLNFTHRFGNNLATILDKFVYKFGFKSASKNSTQIICLNAFSDALKATERSNDSEVNLIKNFLQKEDIDDFAILTPYNKQVNLLKKRLNKNYYEKIMTIHKSQGSEWDTVIFSVVDDAPPGVGKRGAFFTNTLNSKYNSLNLINTVVSRAKKRLVIVANHEFWLKDVNRQLIGKLIEISS